MRFAPTPIMAAVALSLASGVFAAPYQELSDTVAGIEDQLEARVGVVLVDTATDQGWNHRADERFLMNSTVKVPICAAVLAQRDAGALDLTEEVPVRDNDLIPWAPVTETKVGSALTISELCLAAIDLSDNPATNLLIDRLGGPQAVTQFFRSIGDSTSRLDRSEPGLNNFNPGDPRDTSTPRAMAEMMEHLLLGDALPEASRRQLADWMRPGGVTQALLRQTAPDTWEIFDKSGGGDQTRNLIAVIAPEGDDPWIAALFLSDADHDFETRNMALQSISAAVIQTIQDAE